MTTVLRLTGLVLVVGACAVDDDGLGIETAEIIKDCPEIICSNTGTIAGQPWWELDESKIQFSPVGGFRIKSFKKAGLSYDLRVDGFNMHGIPLQGQPPISGPQLEGAKIVLEQSGGPKWELTIDDVGQTHFQDNPGPWIPTLRLLVAQVLPNGERGPQVPLCPFGETSTFDRHAIVFDGDKFNSLTGVDEATGAAADPWFNLACNDDALWKLALMGHVEAAAAYGYDTTVDDRTAGLRSIVADYCGLGESHTTFGISVDWATRHGFLAINGAWQVESVWREDGAICLTNARYEDEDDIVCPNKTLKPCNFADLFKWPTHSSWLTRVP